MKMMQRILWVPATTEDDPEDKLLWAASRLASSQEGQTCPLCEETNLRFYYHEFSLTTKPARRGTLWVWCLECRRYTHLSGVSLPSKVVDTGTLSDGEVYELERKARLLDWLNQYWDEEKIPHKFSTQ